MSAEDYIAVYGSTLTEAEKRYIRAFGPPSGFHAGPSRNPSTPGLSVGDYGESSDELRAAEQRAHDRDEEEAAEWGAL